MATDLRTTILAEIDQLISKLTEFRGRPAYSDYSDISRANATYFNAAVSVLVHRVASANSPYAKQLDSTIPKLSAHNPELHVVHYAGVLRALRDAVDLGYLTTVQELAHADLFNDFLDMADYLLSEGYKDPAAVLIGGVLEEHLHKLCVKNGIDTEFTDSSGRVRPKKAETMNAELTGVDVYSLNDQKNVTAWYDLRSLAAHGKYDKYEKPRVEIMLFGVREFVTRNPA